ncbi:MAG: polyisoprenoid-binding protein [Verrucomicrobia bacterium]|nr:MAG: polyisoprenoid-binding protein [Verrucomicrobiota bacterium]PYK44094.1 MAG: polyisoprenoid-binding protein [Verrucomicrobiota bacterium]
MRPGFQTSRFVCLCGQSRQNGTEIERLASRTSFATLQLRFPKNDIMNSRAPNLIAAVIIAGLASVASAKDTYKFDPSGSTIGFSVHQFLGTTRGKFTNFSGKIEIDREHLENSSVTAQIDVSSIDTRIKKRDDHLRSAEFFNAEKFPRVTFKSRSVKQTGPQSGDILGDFTMHGVTRPITLHVKLLTPINETAQTRWAVTTDPINRREFNLMFAPATETVSGISQTVAINIEIEAKRAE